MRRSGRLACAAFVALLAIAALAYSPGVHGPFFFDDLPNLQSLGAYGPIDSGWKALAFITSGYSGPLGRPLTLASFLLDARDWPAPALAFKLTNVALHLLNGALLAGLLAALTRALGVGRQRAAWTAVLAAGLWMLAPLWVSTTLYVVQRMAMLAAGFVLGGLWGYVAGRALLARGRSRAGYALMTASVVGATALATLSKENGAVLPLLAWILEIWILDAGPGRAAPPAPRGFVWWRRFFIVLPALALIGYWLSWLPAVFDGARGARDFSAGQRLLTEGRVLWSYLADLWLIRAHPGGLFHDDLQVSTDLFHPLSTFWAWAGLIALGAAAWRARRAEQATARAAGAALAFFFAGHLLESTWLQLELVFEHRSYLPALLMFWPLALGLTAARTPELRRGAAWLCLALLAISALQTARRADLWGRPFQQALQWAGEHPHSARAQAYLSSFWVATGNAAQAASILDTALREQPRALILLVARAGVACADGSEPQGLRGALLDAAAAGDLGERVASFQFDTLLDGLAGCRAFGADFAPQLIGTALRNPRVLDPALQRDWLHRLALDALAHQRVAQAWDLDLRALRVAGTPPDARLRMAAELGAAGQPGLALRLLDSVPSPLQRVQGWGLAALHQRVLRRAGFYADSEAHLRSVLRDELAAAAPAAQ